MLFIRVFRYGFYVWLYMGFRHSFYMFFLGMVYIWVLLGILEVWFL